MKSFDADTMEVRNYQGLPGETDTATRSEVNANMLAEELLSVERFPEARVENAKLTASGQTSKRDLPEYVLERDCILHEIARLFRIQCDAEKKDGWHRIRGAIRMLQSDYGIKPSSELMGAVGVKDDPIILEDLRAVPNL